MADCYDDFKEELKRPGVTRWRLWSEYRQSHPGGYSYSQFCWHLQQLGKADQVTMAGCYRKVLKRIHVSQGVTPGIEGYAL